MKLTTEQENLIRISDELQDNLEGYSAPKITVEIPTNFSMLVRDYHEFDLIQDYLELALDLEYQYQEIGCDGLYEALFYIGPKPEKLIAKMKETYN